MASPFQTLKRQLEPHVEARKRTLDKERRAKEKKEAAEKEVADQLRHRNSLFCTIIKEKGIAENMTKDVCSVLESVYLHCKSVIEGKLKPEFSAIGISARHRRECVGKDEYELMVATGRVLAEFGINIELLKFGFDYNSRSYWKFSCDADHQGPHTLRFMNGREFGPVMKKWADARCAQIAEECANQARCTATPEVACSQIDELLIADLQAELKANDIPYQVSMAPGPGLIINSQETKYLLKFKMAL